MLATHDLTGEWFSDLGEMVEDIIEKGYEVLEANRECIVVQALEEEDVQYILTLGGTERTIYIADIEEA